MRRARKAPWAVGLALLVTGATMAAAPPLPQLNMARLLERYAAGEFETVARIVVEAEAATEGAFLVELRAGGQRWVDRAVTWDESRRRRLVAAALALEAAGAPSYVTARDGDPAGPTLVTIPRFPEAAMLWRPQSRASLVAWATDVLLDRRSSEQPILPAVPTGQQPTALDEAERCWFLAALALRSVASDLNALVGAPPIAATPRERQLAALVPRVPFLKAALSRFPDEPRFKLAEVYFDERRTINLNQANVVAIQTQTPEDGVIPKRLLDRRPDPQAVTVFQPGVEGPRDATDYALSLLESIGAGYEALAAEPTLRAEALVRLGYHQVRVGDRDAAIEAFTRALDGCAEAEMCYLAHFFRGWTLHRTGRRAEAERDYEAALRIHPAGRQVRALLAAVLADRGDRHEAREVLGEFLSRTLPERDPWTTFHQGEYRFWPQRVVAMREALR